MVVSNGQIFNVGVGACGCGVGVCQQRWVKQCATKGSTQQRKQNIQVYVFMYVPCSSNRLWHKLQRNSSSSSVSACPSATRGIFLDFGFCEEVLFDLILLVAKCLGRVSRFSNGSCDFESSEGSFQDRKTETSW